MKKKVSIIAALLIGMFAFPAVVAAKPSFSLDCSTILSDVRNGESTDCNLNIVADPKDSKITTIKAQFTSPNMTFDNFVTNPTAWQTDNNKDEKGYITINNVYEDVLAGEVQIGTIHATLNQDATECGKICLILVYQTEDGSSFDNVDVSGAENGECTLKTPDPEPTPNPPTGTNATYGSYIVLAGGAVIALAAVSYARKSTKFYRV